MNEYFNTNKPYKRAKNITNGDELYKDLVSHVYLIMLEYKGEIDNVEAMFTTICFNQWHWKESTFNKLFRPLNDTYSVESFINYEAQEVECNESIHQKFLRDYLDSDSEDVVDWYKKELAKLILQGMTYREIQKNTSINLRYISETIKQFIKDVNSDFYSRSIKHGGTNSTTTEH